MRQLSLEPNRLGRLVKPAFVCSALLTGPIDLANGLQSDAVERGEVVLRGILLCASVLTSEVVVNLALVIEDRLGLGHALRRYVGLRHVARR